MVKKTCHQPINLVCATLQINLSNPRTYFRQFRRAARGLPVIAYVIRLVSLRLLLSSHLKQYTLSLWSWRSVWYVNGTVVVSLQRVLGEVFWQAEKYRSRTVHRSYFLNIKFRVFVFSRSEMNWTGYCGVCKILFCSLHKVVCVIFFVVCAVGCLLCLVVY